MMLKKITLIILEIAMIVSIMPITVSSATEYTEGYYTYTIENGEATITDVDKAISGDIVIPDTLGGYPVTKIGHMAFYNCWHLKSVDIPDNVTAIGWGAFDTCIHLKSVNIPDKVTTIGKLAFYSTMLTSVYIPAGVISIGDRAFSYCKILTSINVNENNTTYKSEDGVLFTKDGTVLVQYPIDKRDSSYVINSSVLSIGSGAFEGSNYLTSVIMPDSIITINANAFAHCNNLKGVDISDSLTTIDVCAFYSCEWLTSIDLPDSLTTIGEFAFSDCDNLTSMVVPDSVTSIGMGAFDSCRNLTLHCYEDSYAHRYAVDNYKAYELIKRLIPGDADGNNEVNFSDVICILKHIAKWDVSLNNDAADVTGDDTINLSDVTLLMQYIAEWDVVWG